MAQVDRLRADLAAKRAEIDALDRLPPTVAEIEQRVAAVLADLDRRSNPADLGSHIAHPLFEVGTPGELRARLNSLNAIELTALTAPDLLAKLLTKHAVDASKGAGERISATERRKRRLAIEAEILKIEVAEERAIEALEADGGMVVRRPDVRPEIVLGVLTA